MKEVTLDVTYKNAFKFGSSNVLHTIKKLARMFHSKRTREIWGKMHALADKIQAEKLVIDFDNMEEGIHDIDIKNRESWLELKYALAEDYFRDWDSGLKDAYKSFKKDIS